MSVIGSPGFSWDWTRPQQAVAVTPKSDAKSKLEFGAFVQLLVAAYGFWLNFPRPFSIFDSNPQGKSLMDRMAIADFLLIPMAVLVFPRIRGRISPQLFPWIGLTVTVAISAILSEYSCVVPSFIIASSVAVGVILPFLFRAKELRISVAKGFSIGYAILLVITYYDSVAALTGAPMLYRDLYGRVRGPFYLGAQLGFHLYGAMFILLFLAASFEAKWWRRFAYGCIIATMPVLLLTGRRTASFALVAAMLALAVNRAWRQKAGAFLLIGALTVCGFLVFANQDEYWNSMESRYTHMETVVGADFFQQQFDGAILAFQHSPMFGIGWGAFEQGYSSTGHELHNTYLGVLAETGVIGSIMFLAGMVSIVILCFKTLAGGHPLAAIAPLAAFLLGCFFAGVHDLTLRERLFWLAFALLMTEYKRLQRLGWQQRGWPLLTKHAWQMTGIKKRQTRQIGS
jgi:O-antigen ligase